MNVLEIFQSTNTELFTLFEQVAQKNLEAALLLQKLTTPSIEKNLQEIHKREEENDEIVHRIYKILDEVFATPIDREDAVSLAHTLDDVMDGIHESAEYISLYQAKRMTEYGQQLADSIAQGAHLISEAMPYIRSSRSFSKIFPIIDAIHKVENDADAVRREGLKALFEKKHDPLDVLRWRDIYHTMEAVTDRMEDVADIFRHYTAKYR